jgi:4-amino-4-deoxy-L-arabinose transferase-like glycosyltransferase
MRLRISGIRILTLIAVGFMVASAHSFRSAPDLLDGPLYLLAGFVVLGAALLWLRPAAPPTLTADRSDPLRIAWTPLLLGISTLFIVTEVNANLLNLPFRDRVNATLQFLLFLLGLGGVTVGAAGIRIRLPDARPHFSTGVIALGAVTLMGLFLRIWHLETAVHFFVDEMNFATAVWHANHHDFIPLLRRFSDVASFPYVYPYWQSLTTALFGPSLLGLRLVSAVIGTLTIPAIYFLGRTLFDRRVGLLAAVLLAALPPHIHFSRLGLNNIADPLVGILMLAFLARGLKHHRQTDYVLAGVFLGLTQYFYEGGRVLYPVLALVWLEALALLKRVHFDRTILRRLALTATVALLVAAPFYTVVLTYQEPLLSRFEVAGLGGTYWQSLREHEMEQTFDDHLLLPFLIYVRQPELSQFYGGEEPLLLVYVVPFFLLGVTYAIWRFREPGLLLLLLWVFGTSLGNSFLAASAHAARFVVVLPALALLAAVALRCVIGTRWLPPLIAAVLVLVQVGYYFGPHLTVYNRQLRPFQDYQDAIFRAADFPPGTVVCFVTEREPDQGFLLSVRNFIGGSFEVCVLHPNYLAPLATQIMSTNSEHAFFVLPDDQVTIDFLRTHFRISGPHMSPYESVPRSAQFALYHTIDGS